MKNKPHVLLYVPNLIGYVRLVSLLIIPFFILHAPLTSVCLCFISISLDAFDGYLARKLGQESYVGAVLDYTIDRATLAVLQMALALIYAPIWGFFAFVLILDMVSHISHVYSSLFLKRRHHKEIIDTQSKLLSLYYSNRKVLFLTCFFHDLWFGFVYLHHFYPSQIWIKIAGILILPFFLLKTIIHILQLWDSLFSLIKLDELKTKE
ncbi:MAG: CDP-diacylglycerol--inositol 3-phosphatidyltransferase [Gammaproteobacteria bacterium]|nr:CDP-diacylglycerol--inositol 3-phosphatidyltransferase [Gammaproteobacteria bacterium]